jgi:hypothetical protein
LDQLSWSAREKKRKTAIHLTGIATTVRFGTSMLTSSKGSNPIYLKKGKKKRLAIHLTGIDDTYYAHKSRSSRSNSRGISAPPFKIGPSSRDGSHVNNFKKFY